MAEGHRRRVVILGAGVCGLAAAWRLLERDPAAEVVLLEQEDRPGGLARSLTVNGQLADLGPHRIFTELPDVQEFLVDMCGGELEEVRRASRMWLRGGWIEYPPKPLEVLGRLGVAKLAGAGASYAVGKAAALLSPASAEESFESVMVGAFGRQLYDLLVGPYAEKVWKISPAEIHADIARIRVSAGGLDQMVKKLFVPEKPGEITAVKKFHYIAGGVETLVRKLRDGVVRRGGRIVLVRRVVDVEHGDGGVRVAAVNRESGREEEFRADHCVSTIPVGDLLAMLLARRGDGAAAQARRELRYISNFLVCFAVRRRRISDSQWLYFPGRDTVFNRGYEPANFHASMAGGTGESLMVLEVTAHPGSELDGRSDAELVRASLKGLSRVGLFRRSEIAGTLVHRIPNTYPLYDLGYRERMAAIWKYLGTFPRLISTGRQGLFLHNNMDHSIHMGFRAGECLSAASANHAAEYYRDVRRFQTFRIVD